MVFIPDVDALDRAYNDPKGAKAFNEFFREHFTDVIGRTVARQLGNDGDVRFEGRKAQELPKATAKAIRDLLAIEEVVWDPSEVWRMRHNRYIDLDHAAIEDYCKFVEASKPAGPFVSRKKEVIAMKPYESHRQYLVNMLATRILADGTSIMDKDGSLDKLWDETIAEEEVEARSKSAFEKAAKASAKAKAKPKPKPRSRFTLRSTRALRVEEDGAEDSTSLTMAQPLDTFRAGGQPSRRSGFRIKLRTARSRGHWEFEDEGEEELAQELFRDSAVVSHDGEVTAEDVHNIQVMHPEVGDMVVLVWVADSSESPSSKARDNQRRSRPSPARDNRQRRARAEQAWSRLAAHLTDVIDLWDEESARAKVGNQLAGYIKVGKHLVRMAGHIAALPGGSNRFEKVLDQLWTSDMEESSGESEDVSVGEGDRMEDDDAMEEDTVMNDEDVMEESDSEW